MMELLKLYRVCYKISEPIFVAASSIFEVSERVRKLPIQHPKDEIVKIQYCDSSIFV